MSVLVEAAVLEGIPAAAAVIDENGAIIAANSAALRTLEQRDGLEACCGRLRLNDDQENQLLANVAAALTQRGAHPIVRVSRDRERGVWLVRVKPLANGGDRQRLLVTWVDPLAPMRLDSRFLEQLFGLTPAEARLVVSLNDDCNLVEVAETFRISRDTARKHLKSVFRKMGVHRQQQLVRFMALLSLLGGGDQS